MTKKLLVNDGRRDRELVLMDRLIVGRDPTCDLSHEDGLLSRRHAEFEGSGDQVTVRDLGSRNGIFVNGLRTAEQVLRPGDIVQIGPLKVRYAQDGAPISILPEQLVDDATVVIPPPSETSVLPPVMPRFAAVEADSSERTQIIAPVPQAQPARPLTPRPVAIVDATGDDDATHFLPPPKAPKSGTQRMAPPIAAPIPRVAPAMTAPAVPASLPEPAVRTFVFVQLFVLAGLVLLSATIPLVMWRGEMLAANARSGASAPFAWLALPFGVAVVAAYFVGSVINRRFGDALRGATGNSPGIPRI